MGARQQWQAIYFQWQQLRVGKQYLAKPDRRRRRQCGPSGCGLGAEFFGRYLPCQQKRRSWVFSPVTGVLDVIEVGPGYQDSCHPYEVWGLNSRSEIYRYNFCGNNFDQENGVLCEINVGGGEIWGAQCGPNVFRFNFSTGNFEQVTDAFGAIPALTIGPNGVWAIDTGNDVVYQYDDFLGFKVIGCCFTQIQAGGNGVWALSGKSISRLDPSTLNFVHVPGSLVSISVGNGGVWGINSSHQAFAFSTP
jgi:hypothetical protein